MKAVPFIEAANKHRIGTAFLDSTKLMIITRLIDFYSQPFTIDMLANPLKHPIKPLPTDTKPHRMLLDEWIEAEDKVLFEGWKNDSPSEIDYFINVENFEFRIIDFGKQFMYQKNFHNPKVPFALREGFVIPKTINDFISDCNRSGIELIWKQSVINKYFK